MIIRVCIFLRLLWFICTKPAHLRPHWCPCPAEAHRLRLSEWTSGDSRSLWQCASRGDLTLAPFLWSKLICWKRVCYWKIEWVPKRKSSKLLFPADVEFHQVLWVLCPAGSLRSGRKLQLRKAAVGPHGLDDFVWICNGFLVGFQREFRAEHWDFIFVQWICNETLYIPMLQARVGIFLYIFGVLLDVGIPKPRRIMF